MPLILGTNSIKDTGYEVANSCRFNKADTPSLSITPGSNGSNTVWTISMWCKRSNLSDGSNDQKIHAAGTSSTYELLFSTADQLTLYNGSTTVFVTNRKFRDVSAWYHIVVAYNTGASGNDRCKVYINGTQETSFATDNRDDGSAMNHINQSVAQFVGNNNAGDGFDGYIAEVCVIDGTAYAASSFGEFDEDSPNIWKPINVSGLTFGTNGAYFDFESSGNLGNDANGGTDWAENNIAATDQATDTPTNNFATLNTLNVPTSNAPTFKEGALETESATTSGQRFMGSSTIGLTAGKWYAECKIVVIDSATVGISPDVAVHAKDNTYIGSHAHDWSILPETGVKYNNNNGTTHGDAFSANDILMIALDIDNLNVYFGHNGNWFDGSGNADEAAPNSALSLTAPASTPEQAYFFACSDGGGDEKVKVQWNFGNPPYANSSSVADANGYGAFEYTVPSGYLSLCTKNLGSDGG